MYRGSQKSRNFERPINTDKFECSEGHLNLMKIYDLDQYFVDPPLFDFTILALVLIDLIREVKNLLVIAYHSSCSI